MALGLSVLGPKEDAVLTALKSNVTKPGLYFFSGMHMTKKPTDAEDAAWTANYETGHGLILFHPSKRRRHERSKGQIRGADDPNRLSWTCA